MFKNFTPDDFGDSAMRLMARLLNAPSHQGSNVMRRFPYLGEISSRINTLVCLLFLLVLTLPFLHYKAGLVPYSFTLATDLLSALSFLIFLMHMAITRTYFLHPHYLLLLLLFFFLLLIGSLINNASFLSIVWGLRYYLKYVPFFLLPSVWNISERRFTTQIRFLFPFILLQSPIAIVQRLYYINKLHTGDVVTGTFSSCAELGIVMISTLTICFIFYMRCLVSLKKFIAIAIILIIPVILAEIKAAFVFLPLSFLAAILFLKTAPTVRSRKIPFASVLISCILFSLFVISYNFLYSFRFGSIVSFYTTDTLTSYVYRSLDDRAIQRGNYVPRIDALIFAYRSISQNWPTLLFGAGAGNIIPTFKTNQSALKTFADRSGANKTTLTNLLWELGLLASLIYLFIISLLFRDSYKLGRHNTVTSTFSLGWSIVVILFILAVPYTNTFSLHALSFIFWYFSGLIVSVYYRQQTMYPHFLNSS